MAAITLFSSKACTFTYERNALGNSVGDMLQPAQVKAAR